MVFCRVKKNNFAAQQKFFSRQVLQKQYFLRHKVLTEYFFVPISETEIFFNQICQQNFFFSQKTKNLEISQQKWIASNSFILKKWHVFQYILLTKNYYVISDIVQPCFVLWSFSILVACHSSSIGLMFCQQVKFCTKVTLKRNSSKVVTNDQFL